MSNDDVKGRINPRTVPQGRVAWPAAFRLRPQRIPADVPLALLGEDTDALDALRVLTAPSGRHIRKQVPAGPALDEHLDGALLSAFATSIPEWRFASRGQQHSVVSNSLAPAISVAAEIYSQFLKDTSQPETSMNFVVERYRLNGSYADISDTELFPACYEADNWQVPQTLVSDLKETGVDGLIYSADKGQSAVVLRVASLQFQEVERAISLEWTGSRFSRAFDYRILQWRDLV